MQTPRKTRVLVIDDARPTMLDKLTNLRGEFSLIARDKSGKIVEEYHDKNLIVNVGKTSLARLLGGGGSGKFINRIAFGTNGLSPEISDTIITNSVTRVIDGVTYPEFNSVAIAWTLPYAIANGLSIAEFGLLSQDDTLFARKTRTPIAKTIDLQLTGVWKIIF
jgi:hypothetical protein